MHGQVSAVMGPSGSGKSTLLAVLMGTATYGTFTGQVWINNRLMRLSRLRRIMGYVPQVRRYAYFTYSRTCLNLLSRAGAR